MPFVQDASTGALLRLSAHEECDSACFARRVGENVKFSDVKWVDTIALLAGSIFKALGAANDPTFLVPGRHHSQVGQVD